MKSLNELKALARKKNENRLAVVAANDEPVLKAVQQAIKDQFIQPILIGDAFEIRAICQSIGLDVNSGLEIIDEPDPSKAAYIAVELVRKGKADILMKGMISTAPFLKAIIHKEKGIKKTGTLSHFALFETKYYHKLLGLTDAAMHIAPTLDEKKEIINNAVHIMHRLGYSNPKVAIVTPLEVVNHKIESTVHASLLKEMNLKNEIIGCIIDGPLALDNAVSFKAAEHKGIHSNVAGDADILVVPDLNSGNILYKSIIFLGDASSAAVITGAEVPIVLTSRSDSDHSKLLSIALAVALK